MGNRLITIAAVVFLALGLLTGINLVGAVLWLGAAVLIGAARIANAIEPPATKPARLAKRDHAQPARCLHPIAGLGAHSTCRRCGAHGPVTEASLPEGRVSLCAGCLDTEAAKDQVS